MRAYTQIQLPCLELFEFALSHRFKIAVSSYEVNRKVSLIERAQKQYRYQGSEE